MSEDQNLETATFGAGCFWGVEDAFMKTPGVVETAVGFMGGDVDNPSYELVCTGETGHVEVTQVKFDPKKISYQELVAKFWEIHDPTQLNRQGPDIGEQYRSVIFYHSPEQKEIAEDSIKKLQASGKFHDEIVTSVEPARDFYRAEDYHQKYYQKQGH